MDDSDSWREFYQTYRKLIYTSARSAGLTDPEAEDVVQETLISVSKNMAGFEYDGSKGSFKSWLLKLTSWRIADQLRKRRRHENGRANSSTRVEPEEAFEVMAAPDLEAIWDEEWDGRLFQAAVQRVKNKANAREYQIFDLAVVQEWPIPKISALLKVDAARVYRCKHRVLALIKLELQQLNSKLL